MQERVKATRQIPGQGNDHRHKRGGCGIRAVPCHREANEKAAPSIIIAYARDTVLRQTLPARIATAKRRDRSTA